MLRCRSRKFWIKRCRSGKFWKGGVEVENLGMIGVGVGVGYFASDSATLVVTGVTEINLVLQYLHYIYLHYRLPNIKRNKFGC